MSGVADTSPDRSALHQFWPESSSPTDLESYKRWVKSRANETSLLFGIWTLPSLELAPSLKLTPVSFQEVSITSNVSPLVSAFEDPKPLSVSFFSTPPLTIGKGPWTSRIIPGFPKSWIVSKPISATVQNQNTVADLALENIVLSARGVRFEDGVENDFSRGLVHFVTTYGDRAVDSLRKAILDRKVPPEISSEALTWLARVKDPSTYDSRLRLLIKALLSPSSQVRDGASLGLALLNDPAALPWARFAVQLERNSELRDDMAKVLSQLESRH